ncbi:oxygen-independent coproporphyrinogen III oxidase [Geminicoccaceae bacterium 1502E]|nr:oxygen-independent coproporphyrinogen III oxidase [Geminicoccaceae bacterium 1502E]
MRPEILARYGDQRIPRYTSYPAATRFAGEVDPETCRDWLAAVPRGALASLYLHIPFCRSMCWYCGCHTTVTRREAPVSRYLEALRGEVRLVADALPHRLEAAHVHFGGGTPTILQPPEFEGLMTLLRQRFALRTDAEVAVEIDPRTLTAGMVAALARAGVTRASLGVQSFDPAVQRAINRAQGFAETRAAVHGLRAGGIAGISLDLLYGLPHQTVASCEETVVRCLELRPDRLSVFGYAHVPAFKPHQRRIDETMLPGAAERHAQAGAIAAALVSAGYRRIGLDHYAAPGDAMTRALDEGRLHRNFQGYTTDPADLLLGFGASAIGRLPQGYVQNATSPGAYERLIASGSLATVRGCRLSAEDRLRAELIERVMCEFRVDIAAVCRRHGRDAAELREEAAALARLEADGLVRRRGDLVEVETAARPLVRAVAACFDAHLASSTARHAPAV